MTSRHINDNQDFVTRQYANLIARGMDTQEAQARLSAVLGESAIEFLESDAKEKGSTTTTTASRLTRTAQDLGGSIPDTHAAFMSSVYEARLFALDWWRPIRTFLLYILFLLAVAIALAAYFYASVLPEFAIFDKNMHVHGQGAASWLMSDGAMRLFGPLIVIAILLVILTAVWFWMRFRMARLQPWPA